jgi:hypothetical protein
MYYGVLVCFNLFVSGFGKIYNVNVSVSYLLNRK